MRSFVLWLLSLLGPFEDISKAVLSRLAWVVLLIMEPFLFVASTIGMFVVRWWNSRDRLWLVQGMPAFLTAIAVSATSLAAWLPTRRDIANRYLDMALKTSEDGDDASALLYVEKASRGRAWNASDSTEFRRALVLEQMGHLAEGQQLLLELAPIDRIGHIPAHELVIDRLNAEKNERAEELLKIHTALILSENPNHARVHRLLAVKAIQAKDLDAAIEHMSHAVRRFERLRLPYAQLLHVAKQHEESERQAELLSTFFEPMFADDSVNKGETTIADQDRVAYAACLTMLKRYDEAILRLRDGPGLPTKPVLRNAMANTFLIWSDKFDSESMVSLTDKMIRLDSALKLAPNSPAILSRVAQISTLKGKPAEEANERLRQMLAEGKAPAIVHFILGTSAAEANDTEKALFHLEQASRINPNVPVTLNNLAWVMCHEPNVERPRLEHASRLVQKALKFKPMNPQFRETNGQVLIKLEEWRDAITEFEFALQYLKGAQPEIHRSLAVAYANVGDLAMSKMHSDLIGAVSDDVPESDDLPGSSIPAEPLSSQTTGPLSKDVANSLRSGTDHAKPVMSTDPVARTGKVEPKAAAVPLPRETNPGEPEGPEGKPAAVEIIAPPPEPEPKKPVFEELPPPAE